MRGSPAPRDPARRRVRVCACPAASRPAFPPPSHQWETKDAGAARAGAGWCSRRRCRGPEPVEGGSTSFPTVPGCDRPGKSWPRYLPPPAQPARPRPAGQLRLQPGRARPLRDARRLGPALWGRVWRARRTHTRYGWAGDSTGCGT